MDRARHVPRFVWVLTSLTAGAVLATCSADRRPSPPSPETQPAPAPAAARATDSEAETRVRALRSRFPGAIGPAAFDAFRPGEGGSLGARVRAPRPLSIDLPGDASAPVRMADERSGIAVSFALEGASRTAPALAAGAVVYRGAAATLGGGDVIHRVHPHGDEDFVHFPTQPANEQLRYHLDVSSAAGLRLVERTLELLDARGAPRLRVAPPVVFDAAGKRVRASLSLEGCAADHDPRAPHGRPVTAPGAASCELVVSWAGTGVRYPALVDPSWQSTASMVDARWGHAVAPLPSLSVPPTLAYRVLVTGGFDASNTPLDTAEIYEPLSQTFTVTSSMHFARAAHTATAVSGSATGRVFIAGTAGSVVDPNPPEHLVATAPSTTSATTELYDEVSGTFLVGPSMSVPRFYHTATALVDGRIVLAGGTTDTAGTPTASGDIFTPDASNASGGTIVPALSAMHAARFGHAAALLSTGAVLLTGGIVSGGAATAGAETFCPPGACTSIFNSDNKFFVTTTSMAAPRAFHTASALHTGDVLLAGGVDGYGSAPTYSASAEVYSLGVFLGALIPTAQPRAFHAATKLAPLLVLPTDGGTGTATAEVLLAGGFDGNADLATAEAYFPATGSVAQSIQTTTAATTTRRHPAAVLVNDGSSVSAGNGVLLMGGVTGSADGTNGAATSSAELFLKIIGDPCESDQECLTGHCADGFCCDTACGSDCFSCASALKQDPTSPNGVCAASKAGLLVSIDCVPGTEVEVHTHCDGQGHAKPGTDSIVCLPSVCGANNRCSTFCDDGANKCSTSGWCNFDLPPDGGVPDAGDDAGSSKVGTCQRKGDKGQACTADDQCGNGNCYDGFCCDVKCTNQCQACDVPTVAGTCTTLGITGAEAPHVDPLHPRSGCNGDGTACIGLCAGLPDKCTYPYGFEPDGGVDQASTFQPAACSATDGGTRFYSFPCDGDGGHTEVDAGCGGFQCDDAHTCKSTCSQDTDCIKDHICVFSAPGSATGTCQLLDGPLCDGNVTLRQPTSVGGNAVCDKHYACPAGAKVCNTSCLAVTDCASGFVCDDSQTCVAPLSAPALPSCSCRAPADDDTSGWAPAVLAFGALAFARRRRRA